MTEQFALTLVATTIGFLAAMFFCIGNIMNTANSILLQSSPFWDFSELVARALASQRAQYVVGALLLVISFALQVAAVLASSTKIANLPQYINTWPCLVLVVLIPSGLLAACFSAFLYKSTIMKVLQMVEEQMQKEENHT